MMWPNTHQIAYSANFPRLLRESETTISANAQGWSVVVTCHPSATLYHWYNVAGSLLFKQLPTVQGHAIRSSAWGVSSSAIPLPGRLSAPDTPGSNRLTTGTEEFRVHSSLLKAHVVCRHLLQLCATERPDSLAGYCGAAKLATNFSRLVNQRNFTVKMALVEPATGRTDCR